MATTYVALRRIKMGKNLYRLPGEAIPEAASWKNLRQYIAARWVKEITTRDIVAPKKESTGVKCQDCGETFLNDRGLDIHRRRKHKEG